MVNRDKGPPQPLNGTEEQFSTNGFVTMPVGTDSDSEEDTVPNGYEPLPLGPPDDVNNDSNGSEDEEEEDSGVDSGSHTLDDPLPSVDRIENELVQEVWKAPATVDINMDSDKVAEVKEAMANITLPSCCIPEWASNVPEDQWKEHLFNRLKYLQKTTK